MTYLWLCHHMLSPLTPDQLFIGGKAALEADGMARVEEHNLGADNYGDDDDDDDDKDNNRADTTG